MERTKTVPIVTLLERNLMDKAVNLMRLAAPKVNDEIILTHIKELISCGVNINDGGSEGINLLMAASLYGHYNIVDFLLDRGVRVELASEKGWTALHFAAKAQANSAKIVRLLGKKGGVFVDISTESGITPLMIASAQNDTASMLELIHLGADINERDGRRCFTALIFAIKNESIEAIELLLEKRADLYAVADTNPIQAELRDAANSKDAFYFAKLTGHSGIIELLDRAEKLYGDSERRKDRIESHLTMNKILGSADPTTS